ncbi:hypothetical protein GGR57DRAFT_514609 [Xylariaceae sp. FL1272]|nr:hypothetical protein GGR57DRAFT_514609 [Xylariaceae sp. FL1272]
MNMDFEDPALLSLNNPIPLDPAQRAAQDWIDKEDLIPKDIYYDWLPLCTALVEPFLEVDQSGDNGVVKPVDLMGSLPDFWEPQADAGKHHQDHVYTERVPDRLIPSKDPSTGAWDHVVFIPEWTDPDYKSTSYVMQSGKKFRNTIKDSLQDLRPALRLEDQIRNSTDYARRFGIASDRVDGRSRMSPTWAPTRDTMVDFMNQVDMLSDQEREEAERASKEIYSRSGQTAPPGQEVLPIVMSEVLQKHGLLHNVGLMSLLRHYSGTTLNLEQVIEDLNRINPDHKKVHMTFFDMVQQDQDYQRLLMADMTTDEAIQRDIHTMDDSGPDCDLDNPIIPLFARQRWESSSWKGAEIKTPKYAYSIGNSRELWDATTNDKLWHALQPALRLASKIFSSKHPHIEALFDMNTRQRVPYQRDPRTAPETASLAKYVLQEDIDMNLTWPQIRVLHEQHNYDWKTNVLNILRALLRIDIGSAYTQIGYSDPYSNGPKPTTFHYGSTRVTLSDQRGSITLKLSADLIWPLLVDGYSKSEKSACSLLIANTLLHELAHCIIKAQQLLTSGVAWARPHGQTDEVAHLLRTLGQEMWDFNTTSGEPFFQNSGFTEVGHQLETELWGHNICNLLETSPARFLVSQPIAVAAVPWPTGYEKAILNNTVKPPIELYNRPLPISFVAKYFTKNWWAEEYSKYGHAAFKKLPDAQPLLSLLRPRGVDHATGFATFGDDVWKFMIAVPTILRQGRHGILSEYVYAVITEALGPSQMLHRWADDIVTWRKDVIDPLEEACGLLQDEFTEARRLSQDWHSEGPSRDAAYQKYCVDNGHDPKTREEWDAEVEENFIQEFRDGGWIMAQLVEVHQLMQVDFGILERMIFDFLTVDPQRRSFLYQGQVQGASTPLGIAYARMLSCLQFCENIATTLGTIITVPSLFEVKDKFDAWRARFEANRQAYINLVHCIDTSDATDPASQDWKTKFPRIPSAYWKLRSQSLEKLAFREYSRADPAVRRVVDEVLDELRDYHNDALEIQGPASVEEIENTLRNLPGWDPVAGDITNKRRGLFDFSGLTKPPPPPVSVPELPMSGDLARPQTSSSTGTGGIAFGRPGGPSRLGGVPPRRASGREAFRKYGLGENALRRVASGRITTHRAQDRNALAGVSQAALNAAGLPDVIRSQQGRMEGPQPRQVDPNTILPFPSAYGNRTTLTSEVQAHASGLANIDEIIADYVDKDQIERGVYQAPGIFRESNQTDSP